jgi:hypothetical protein
MHYAEHFFILNEEDEWEEVTEIILDDSIIEIGKYSFSGFDNVTNVEIPDSVTSIGIGAFKGLNNLESITLPFVGKSEDATAYQAVFGYIFGYSSSYYSSSSSSSSSTDFINTAYGTKP